MKCKQQINKVHPYTEFDFSFSYNKINFLDTAVYKIDSDKFETKLYRKESDWQAFLHGKSDHLGSLKRSIPFVQAFRIRRIRSTESEFHESFYELPNWLIERGYKEEEINKEYRKTTALRVENKKISSQNTTCTEIQTNVT